MSIEKIAAKAIIAALFNKNKKTYKIMKSKNNSTQYNFKGFIQVAGIIDKSEAKLIMNSGATHLGFPLRLPVNKEDISEQDAAELISELKIKTNSILITYLDKAADIIEFCDKLGVGIVQLHGDISITELAALKKKRPDITVIKSLVVGKDSPEKLKQTAIELSFLADAFITDTFDPQTKASGATGKTHDWEISAEFAATCEKPIILAGGLNEKNVYQAIMQVKPAGVDVHTGVEAADGRKDAEKLKEFIRQANAAFRLI